MPASKPFLLMLSRADLDDLIETLGDLPYRHAMVVVGWVNKQIHSQEREQARLLRETEEMRATGVEPSNHSFWDLIDTPRARGEDDKLH